MSKGAVMGEEGEVRESAMFGEGIGCAGVIDILFWCVAHCILSV